MGRGAQIIRPYGVGVQAKRATKSQCPRPSSTRKEPTEKLVNADRETQKRYTAVSGNIAMETAGL